MNATVEINCDFCWVRLNIINIAVVITCCGKKKRKKEKETKEITIAKSRD
jgi:hypothetical protein